MAHSPYLSGLSERYGATQEDLNALIEAARSVDSAEALQDCKNKFALRWAIESLSPDYDFDRLGLLQSRFADATIETALRLAWHETKKRFSIKAEWPEGLFILGLGKLGGNDLNFSSDIDLIGFYDPDILPVSVNKGQAHIINQCLKSLTQILMPRNSPDHIWRVDWRLRPESSGTGLALSTVKAEKFYFFRALPWHRLALMKARVVAGDKNVGTTFLQTLSPFIWPQNLDFRALDDLADLKTRINEEHPGLSFERKLPHPITKDPAEFNVKLGSGGIREIEFIANALQLIWGGKQPLLKQTQTRKALTYLADLNHLESEISDGLKESYIVLRQIENAIQMLRNEQTHLVPSSKNDQDFILASTPYASWEELSEKSFTTRTFVNYHFQRLFEAETVSPSAAHSSIEISDLSPVGKSIAESWLRGFDEHGLPKSLAGTYVSLGETLFQRVIYSVAETELALTNIDRFLKTLSRSAQYLDLLNRNEGLLDTLVTPLLYSPHMTDLLKQSPHIIDIFLVPQKPWEPDMSVILSTPDYGTRLDRLRRFVNEHLFLYYHGFMEKGDSLEILQTHLNHLAEITLETSLSIVEDVLEIDPVQMSVLGLGKMGTQSMAPQSDLDLVFIFEDNVDSELAAKIVRRLKTTLMTPLKEGIAYELDMRLRPSGRSGPPAVKLSSFQNHHDNRAHSWEHIALAHSGVIAGNLSLGVEIESLCQTILERPRDKTQFLQDAWFMWNRIKAERIGETPHSNFNAKLREGGLMQAQYLEACRKVLGLPPSSSLKSAIHFWQYQQVWERLLGLSYQPIETVPPRYKDRVFQDNRRPISFEAYIQKSQDYAALVIEEGQVLFSQMKPEADTNSKPVKWLS